MNDNYILMHKEKPCAMITIDEDSNALTNYKVIEKEFTPFLGNADERLMKKWWENRAVPGARKDFVPIYKKAGCDSAKGYLAKNLALSLTDTYWICPVDMDISWNEVNLFDNYKSLQGIVALHNESSYDPNASLGGEMTKYWDISSKKPVLVKSAYRSYGQQSINEAFASYVHEKQAVGISYVSYTACKKENGEVLSYCDAFTSKDIEFISAYEILNSVKRKGSVSDFECLISACAQKGIDENEIRRFMDYLFLSDAVISNTDEHLQNFGILRDANTMELIGPAPIFDSGNSMFYNIDGVKPMDSIELLKYKINSITDKEEKILKHISNKEVVSMGSLPDKNEVAEFYSSYGIPEERVEFISKSYSNKIEIIKEFQAGKSISLYNETHKEK